MTYEVFLAILFAVSILTSLTVEGLKKFVGSDKFKSYNVLAGVVAIALSVVISVCYCIVEGITFNAILGVYILALIFLSWLSSMLGYDKVIQSLSQIKNNK